ncbi:MAG: hypothetical protein M3Q56_09630 [Bacteroidota bacterium]|nr:hypothetical protein [Bacteroidota bacterium]
MMKGATIILLFLFFFYSKIGQTQNLIQDSSFSYNESISKNKYWNNQVTKTGGFYDSRLFTDPLLPWSWAMKRALLIDSSRKDFFEFTPLNTNNSSYLYSDVVFCELTEPLIKDSIYKIQMWVLPPECIAISSIQVYFSDLKLLKVDKIKNSHRADLFRQDSSMIVNNLLFARKKKKNEFGTFYSKWVMQFEDKWLCISGTYKAVGGERYFYVGNVNKFNYVAYVPKIRKNKLIRIKNNDPRESPKNSTEFFIDDVSIRKR